jgi:flagellar motor switch/type III secretory pathway protein FliN
MMDAELPLKFDDVPVEVEAAFAGPTMRVSQLLALRVSGIVLTTFAVGENIPVYAGGSRIGEGELSSRDQRLAFRLVRLGSGN